MEIKFVQLSILDEIIKAGESGENSIEVPIIGAINVHSHPMTDYKVSLSYGDLKLIVAMLRDYVKGLDAVIQDDIQWEAYYRTKFLEMAEKISKQINYDYDEHLKKCLKKAEKENNSDIGGEALSLALKRARAQAKSAEDEKGQDEKSAGPT